MYPAMKGYPGVNSNNLFAETVKSDRVRYVINVTIESAENFIESSSIYVQYIVDISSDWEVSRPESLQGVTHQSKTRFPKCHFGHTFTLDISTPFHPSKTGPTSFPLLLFEVYDVDLWNRQKSVGYGFAHLNLSSGCHSETVSTWRPHRKNPTNKLEDYFLGLAPQLENLDYAGIPYNDDGLLSRFPFATKSSGTVRVRFDTMIQRGKDVLEHEWKSSTYKPRSNTINNAVDDVIQAYQRAKQRLKAVHNSLLRQK